MENGEWSESNEATLFPILYSPFISSRRSELRPSTFLARYSTFSSLDHRATNTQPINSRVHHASVGHPRSDERGDKVRDIICCELPESIT